MKVIPITPADPGQPPEDEGQSLYASAKKIYPRAVTGTFAHWRWAFVWATQLVFYGLPWLQWGERQAVLFDLAARRFYIFGLVLYPQDFIYLTGLLVISALSLFLFTAVAGRLWCGFACPQTVYTEMFLWIERKVEGDRNARMKLDAEPMSGRKFGRKALKHALWVALAMWTGFTFVGYFTPIRQLAVQVLHWTLGPWETFWIFFYGFATYGNAGFMREQVCKYMCPYARFQSAMFDKDTLIVTYDAERGEPRGARSRKADRAKLGVGDCVDCTLCVQVCPTGIDIRKGLQYECIACAACIDACDSVMDRIGYPRGLVRYSTQHALEHRTTHVVRPRVIVYGALLAVLALGFVIALLFRPTTALDVIRDRASLYRLLDDGRAENVYTVKILNKSEQGHDFTVGVSGPGELALDPAAPRYSVGPGAVYTAILRVRRPAWGGTAGSGSIRFEVVAADDPRIHASHEARFLAPAQ